MTKAIISYDDTANDQDALSLGQVFADAGATLTLAYVRHSTHSAQDRERLEERDAQTLLERGAQMLGASTVDRRVVVSASTADGLRHLAEEEGAGIIVFGSDYRTSPGHVAPQKTAQTLLEGGPTAIAIAPANFHSEHASRFGRIGLLADPGDDSSLQTARELAESLNARVTRDEPYVDLLVVGSRSEAPDKRVMITSQAQRAIENATCPVLVVPRGVTVHFPVAVPAI
jgi:nucleotide-binding universal stress UspA family protein